MRRLLFYLLVYENKPACNKSSMFAEMIQWWRGEGPGSNAIQDEDDQVSGQYDRDASTWDFHSYLLEHGGHCDIQ